MLSSVVGRSGQKRVVGEETKHLELASSEEGSFPTLHYCLRLLSTALALGAVNLGELWTWIAHARDVLIILSQALLDSLATSMLPQPTIIV